DRNVTGVQTCALPIYPPCRCIHPGFNVHGNEVFTTQQLTGMTRGIRLNHAFGFATITLQRLIVKQCHYASMVTRRTSSREVSPRSEERRVGKECTVRG